VVDANVLLYAVDRASMHHDRSRTWLDASLSGAEAVGFAWVALLAFVRIGTNPSILTSPMSAGEALGQVEAWLAAPAAVVAQPTARHASILRGLLLDSGTAGNLTNDAHLAALAVEHGADIVSFSRDSARFAGVRHRLPG
jgi:toxin-antitoxin system PIN domain toxin